MARYGWTEEQVDRLVDSLFDLVDQLGLALEKEQRRHSESKLVSMQETRELLGGVSRDSLYKLFASGELKSIKVGRRRMVLRSSIEDFLQYYAS